MNIEHVSDRIIRVVREEEIKAPAAELFPLACPVMEYAWIPGWKCELLHCPNGRVEEGTMFREMMSAPVLTGSPFGKTTWTAVLHDEPGRRVHYKLENRVSSSLNKIEMTAAGPASTILKFDFTCEALNAKGMKILAESGAEKIGFMLGLLAAMMKHYAERGEMLGAAERKRMVLGFPFFTARDKFRLILNEIAMRNMRDENRTRFLRGLPVSVVRNA
jgi:hypothetical protein